MEIHAILEDRVQTPMMARNRHHLLPVNETGIYRDRIPTAATSTRRRLDRDKLRNPRIAPHTASVCTGMVPVAIGHARWLLIHEPVSAVEGEMQFEFEIRGRSLLLLGRALVSGRRMGRGRNDKSQPWNRERMIKCALRRIGLFVRFRCFWEIENGGAFTILPSKFYGTNAWNTLEDSASDDKYFGGQQP